MENLPKNADLQTFKDYFDVIKSINDLFDESRKTKEKIQNATISIFKLLFKHFKLSEKQKTFLVIVTIAILCYANTLD